MPHPLSVSISSLMEETTSTLSSTDRIPAQRASGTRVSPTATSSAGPSRATHGPTHSTRNPLSPMSAHPPQFSRAGYTRAAIPLEILDLAVTRHLEDDQLALKALSLTCRYFCVRTRPQIFRRLHLYMHPTYNQKRGHFLAEILSGGRHLIPHIKHVVVSTLFHEDSCRPHLREDREALRVLLNLTAMTKLSIWGYRNKSWDAIPTNVQLAIRTGMRGKRLSAVEVTDMELSLSGTPRCHPANDKDELAKRTMTFANLRPIYLEKLNLTMPGPELVTLTDWILSDQSALNISRAKSMHVHHRYSYSFLDHPTSVARLLDACYSTVEDVDIELFTPSHTVDITAPLADLVGESKPTAAPACDRDHLGSTRVVEDVYNLIDIAKLKSLRRLYVSFRIPNMYDERRHVTLLSQIFRNVNEEGRASQLEELGMFFWQGHNPFGEVKEESRLRQKLAESGSWDHFDCALSSAGSRFAPKRVVIQLAKVADLTEGAKLMEMCLPRLTSRGVLVMSDTIKRVNN
ncbi:hypothetical protein DFP72DRAFT_890293 [Ephemerocybe angulata]|uniref:Uncharacterized protein n=1 Tax=Ephemerocybe angulata TaxID=980116 RepID=A0A8H6I2E4_9AGAR|nr:hypothetical protein DFP72DRAFT_890293 [Tulosesus angulatus]